MNSQPYVIERVYNVPVEKVWQALTQNEQLQQWYFKLPAFKAEVGFTFTFTGGPKNGTQYTHLCQVTEVIANKKLSYTWKYEGYGGESEVSIELFAEGDGTRLKLTHTGLETFPSANPDFAVKNFAAGWEYITGTCLMGYLEKA